MQITWTKEIPEKAFNELSKVLLKDFGITCSLNNKNTIVFDQKLTFPLQRFCEGFVLGALLNLQSD